MAKKTAGGGPVRRREPKAADQGPESKQPRIGGRKKRDRLVMVQSLIIKWTEKLEQDVTKAGVAELIRLLVLEKELSETRETVKGIKVTWVEPIATESSKSE